MRRMWAALAGTRRPSRTIPRALQVTALCAASSYMGQNLKVSKYSPADIVSQLFHLDNSGLDSNPEPLRLRGIQCIPDDSPWDSEPCLCAASPSALRRTGVTRLGPRLCHLVMTCRLHFGTDCSMISKFSLIQKFLDLDSALLPKVYRITSWVMFRVQDGGGEAAISCFL